MTDGLATVQFGVTDLCNFRCVMCPQTAEEGLYGAPGRTGPRLHGGRRGFMEPALFRRVLAGCERAGFPLGILSLVWLGEPLLHPAFADLFEAALDFGERTGLAEAVVFNTNASLLTPDLSAAIVSAFAQRATRVRSTVTFSLDAATPETYARLKPGADLDATLANVSAFLETYAARRPDFRQPFVILFQMIVLEENAAEAEAFRDRFAGLAAGMGLPCDVGFGAFGECAGEAPLRVVFKRASTENQAEMDLLHRRTMTRLGLAPSAASPLFDLCQRVGAESPRHACSAAFETAVVDWDGRVTPCCADSELELCVGSLETRTLPELYAGPAWRALRRAHLSGDLSAHPRCAGCAAAVRPTIPPDRLARYRDELAGE